MNNQGQVVRRYDFLPFGEEIVAGVGGRGADYEPSNYVYPTTPDDVLHKFTGKERDAETGLDYFGARYFSGPMGRFVSADWAAVPAAVPYASLGDPQTLNLYSYTRNNPMARADANGHCLKAADNESCLGDEKFAVAEDAHGLAPMRSDLILPKDPAGLGPEWTEDKTNQSPNREEWVRGDGTKLAFDKGRKGLPGWRGKDHLARVQARRKRI
jgi:RHS repeat-associated protein